MKQKSFLCFLLFLGLATMLSAQLSGTYSIPGNYPTIAAAVTALNSAGVGTGGVTFNVAANHTETLTGAIRLTATGTASNHIVFQRIGGGANPLVTAHTGTSANPSIPDGIWCLEGCDYVTIDGIDLLDLNTAGTTDMMEFGYGLFINEVNYGSQNNFIKNCSITLNRYNDSYNILSAVRGSVGILIINAESDDAQAPSTSFAAIVSNSYNKIYGNTINNCSNGIVLRGYDSEVPYVAVNRGNDIGGSSIATGNHIYNFGGGNDATTAYGIRSYYQWDFNISYNTIDNNSGTGINHTKGIYGIVTFGAPNTDVTINHNDISLKSGSTDSIVYGIENYAGSASISNTVSIAYNRIHDCEFSVLNTEYFYVIRNRSDAWIVNITNNIIENCPQMMLRNFTGISCTGGYNKYITSNIIRNLTHTGDYGNWTMVYFVSPDIVISDNQFYNITANPTSTTSGIHFKGISFYSTTNPCTVTLSGNSIYNFSINGSNTAPNSSMIGMSLQGTSTESVRTITNNHIYGFEYNTGRYASLQGIIVHNGVSTIAGNRIHSLYANGSSSSVMAIKSNPGTNHIYNNMIYDLSAAYSSLSLSTTGISSSGDSYISFNTVLLSATAANNGFKSAVLSATNAPAYLKNNIFVNNSVPGLNGLSTVIWSSSPNNEFIGAGSDNNIYYAGTPGLKNLIGYFGSIGYQTLASYKTFMNDKEQNSFTENVPFVSSVTPVDLHINPSVPTLAEGNAIPITEITTDFDNQPRDPLSPDIGADEGDFTTIPEPPTPPVYISPTDLSTGTSITQSLIWNAGPGGGSPASYNIYIGTSIPLPSIPIASTSENTYDPELDYETTYYWKIVATNYSGSAAGPIWSFTTEADTRITSLPHSQNFDTVSPPNLPPGWSQLFANGSSIQTSTAHYDTAPNSVILSLTSDDTSETPPLISPQITVGIENIRMYFRTKWIGNPSSIIVGTMTDPSNESTFTAFSTISLSSDYMLFNVDFSGYTGSDQYLAFKLTTYYPSASISLDTILLQQTQLENDLAVLYMTGWTLGFPGWTNTQSVTIENRGTLTQSSYIIRLRSAEGPTVLSSLNVSVPIEPGQTGVFPISWTPPQEGAYDIYGEVVLTGDEDDTNNTSTTRQINIYGFDTYGVIVGEEEGESMNNYLPFAFSFRNSISETIYTSTEMQMQSGMIEGIIYQSNFAEYLIETPIKLWIKNTDVTDLSAGWLDFTGYTLVFDGLINIENGAYNSVHIPLSAPFAYTGGNLAIRAVRPMDTQSYMELNSFHHTMPVYVENRSRYLTSNAEFIDPANPFDSGFLTSNIPVTYFIAPVATPVVLTAPDVTIEYDGTDINLSWTEIPGAYCYRVFISDNPNYWQEVPDAVIYTNHYTWLSPFEETKYFRVVAVSSYR